MHGDIIVVGPGHVQPQFPLPPPPPVPPEIYDLARTLARVDAWENVPGIGPATAWLLRDRSVRNTKRLGQIIPHPSEIAILNMPQGTAKYNEWKSIYRERYFHHRANLVDTWNRGLIRMEIRHDDV